MKLLKKTAAVVTAASLLAVGNIGIMPRDAVKNFMLSVSAADSNIVASGNCGAYGDNLTWKLDSEGTLTISGMGEMEDRKYITDAPWSPYEYDIVSVVIEDGVTSIGNEAFDRCVSLTSITIPDSVTTIGDEAFYYCKSLTSIILPDGVTSIGDRAFYWCDSLTSITIPDSVTSIGDSAFSCCYSLTDINVNSKNKYYASEDGVLFNKDKSVLILYPKGKTVKEYSILDSVTTIGNDAFFNCLSLTSIIITDSVTTIGDNAFSYCYGLTSVTISDSVTTIGDYAFSDCESLTSITIPNSVTTIGKNVFSYCIGLTSITIPDSVTTIGYGAFSGCLSLTSITIPDSVTTIGYGAFSDCYDLTSITIPDSVTTIGSDAFSYCIGLTSITIPDSVVVIGDGAFSYCDNLTSVTIENPECDINDETYTIFNKYDYQLKEYKFDGTIYGHEGSTAQVYANKYNRKFELIAPLSIVKQPQSVVVPNGEKASVTVNATGDGLTYKWYYKNKSMTKFVESTSMTSATYSVDKMTVLRDGRQLYCVITDKYGNSVKTDTVTLSIGNALKITAQPESVVVPNGKKASVTVNATGDGLTYKWYYKNKSMTKFVESTSMTSATYSVDKMTVLRDGRQLYCVITDKYGNSVKTDTVTLSIGNALKITAQPESVVVPNGEKASVTVNATGDGLTYKWYYKNKGASKFSYTSTFTGNKYSVTMSDSRDGRQIYCVITDKYGNSVKTDTVTLIQE